MQGLIQSPEGLFMVIFLMIAAAFQLQKVKFIKTLGPVLTVILMGIVLSNIGVVPAYTEIYSGVSQYLVPVVVSLYLLNLDLKKAKILLSRDSLISFFSMLFCVCFVTVIAGLYFAPRIAEGWKIAGMFVGTYTGGSSQLTAIGTGLEVSSTTLAIANAADYIVGMPVMILFFAAPALMEKSKWFNKHWPYHLTESERLGNADHKTLMDPMEWSIKDIAYLLAIALTVVVISTNISQAIFPESLKSPMRIIVISTLSILVAQIPGVQKLRGNQDLGLLLSMVFLATIGFQVNIAFFAGSAAMVIAFCAVVIIGSTLLHLLVNRVFKVKYEFTLLSIIAGIADGTTSALAASGANWNTLIQVGLVMGVLAGAIGNYVGIGVAFLLKMLIGA
ncbi:MAG: DUF819 domain-containing protein [Catenisphaera adipataccumulans]|jgi:uncharacterized membrane protein|uniref:DUF819 domain-containing protein n=1 Tax=Catenisphaera adipataccumulans TaxID=700500 RepID=UPI003D8F1897